MDDLSHGHPYRLEVSIDGRFSVEIPIMIGEAWEARLVSVAQVNSAEVCLKLPGGASLIGLFRQGWGWLEWFPGDDSRTLHTENPDHPEPAGTRWEFVLGNGQVDEYPASWTYDFDTVMHAFRYSLETGERDPDLEWVPDW